MAEPLVDADHDFSVRKVGSQPECKGLRQAPTANNVADAEDNRNMVILHRDTFVGTEGPSVVSYLDWSLQDVADVRYSTVDGMPFLF
jgi:hypothetical protein